MRRILLALGVLVFSFTDGRDTTNNPGDREWFYYHEDERTDIIRSAAAGEPAIELSGGIDLKIEGRHFGKTLLSHLKRRPAII
jgi:hypothetical protein